MSGPIDGGTASPCELCAQLSDAVSSPFVVEVRIRSSSLGLGVAMRVASRVCGVALLGLGQESHRAWGGLGDALCEIQPRFGYLVC